MMLAKPKPEPTDTEDQQDNAEAYSPNDVGVDEEDVDTDDREAEIARRLALLSPPEPEEEKVAPPPALVNEDDAVSDFLNTTDIDRDDAGSKPVPVADVEKDLLAPVSLPPVAGVVQQPPVPAPAAVVVQKPQPAPVKVSAPVPVPAAPAEKAKPNNKSALLARIMAAQERAKNAQLKQASSAAPAAPTSVEFEKEKMMRALNGITSETVQKKADPLPVIHTNKFAPPPAPMTFSAPPMAQAMAPPAAKAPQPPPPSFDIFEKQMSQMNIQPPAAPAISAPSAPFATAPVAMAPPPPAFDAIAPQIFQQQPVAPPPSTFSASDVDLLGGNFGGVMPVAPPSVSAPSFDQVMQQNLVGDPYGQSPEEIDFELDENGMKLSPEEKQRMVEEQRAIMEQIARQKRENKASEAAIKADAFANRMTGASGGGQVIPLPPPAMGVDGFSASEVEEQRKILEQLEAAKRGSGGTSQSRNVTNTTSSSASVNTGTGFSASDIEEQRRILEQIEAANGGGQSAAPVSTEFMTREEVMQMEEDRKMAEMLQAQENAAAAEDGDTASGYATAGRSAASTLGSSDDKSSWWGTLNDALVSVGMVSPEEKDPSEMSVSRPPGSGPRMLHSAVTGEERREQVGLLDDYGYGGGDGRPAARMAQPTTNLFSCVVDSVSNTAATAGSYLVGDEDSDEEVHGVDSTSFLSVPNVGRDKSNGGGGNYFAIPPNE